MAVALLFALVAAEAFASASVGGAAKAGVVVLLGAIACGAAIHGAGWRAKSALLWLGITAAMAAPYITVIFIDARWRSR